MSICPASFRRCWRARALRRTPRPGPIVKFDGMRAQVRLERGQLCLRSRPGRDCTEAFPELAELSAGLRKRRVLLDGELVCLNDEGDPDFARLRAGLGSTGREARLAARRAAATFSPSTCSTSTGARRASCPTQGGGRCSPSGRDVGSRADGLAGGLRSFLWGARAGRAPDSAQGGGRSAGGPVSGAVTFARIPRERNGVADELAKDGTRASKALTPIGGDRFRVKCVNVGLGRVPRVPESAAECLWIAGPGSARELLRMGQRCDWMARRRRARLHDSSEATRGLAGGSGKPTSAQRQLLVRQRRLALLRP